MRVSPNIYYNIKESDYIVEIDNYNFYFSSMVYANKFKENINKYVDEELKKFKVKYGYPVNFKEILYLTYYKKIEKRGFYVKYKGETVYRNKFRFKFVLDEIKS